jgi:hypothetical protein
MEFTGLKCFDDKRNPIDLTPENCEKILGQGTEVQLIGYANKIWKVNGKFSSPFTLKAIRVFPTSKSSYEFMPDSDEEEEEVSQPVVQPKAASAVEKEEDDEEEEEEDEEED